MMTEFNLLNYDFYHLGVSGGKDSTAALLWLIYESGLPLDRVDVTFCDTGNEDSLTYGYLRMLDRDVYSIKTISPGLDFWQLALKKQRFPSRRARFCTQWLKVIPSMEYVIELKKRGRVLMLNGVRKAEGHNGNDRGTIGSFGFDDLLGCDVFRPIYDYSISDVWAIHQRYLSLDSVVSLVQQDSELSDPHRDYLVSRLRSHGIPRNPLYDMGASRVGCFPCINSSKAEVRAMAKFRPERVDFIASQENLVGSRGIATFFAKKTIPQRYCSKEIMSSNGVIHFVPTIHDVVEWSKTAWGGDQYLLDLDFHDDLVSCDLRGHCE